MLQSSVACDHWLLTPEIKRWRESIFSTFRLFGHELRATVARIQGDEDAKADARGKLHETRAIYCANVWLRETVERFQLVDGSIHCFSSDAEITDWSRATARALENDVYRLARDDKLGAIDLVSKRCASFEIDVPESVALYQALGKFEDDGHRELFGQEMARLFAPRWWTRQIRVRQARTLETMCREMGLVHAKAGKYCSDYTLRRRWHQKKRNRDLLEKMLAVNENGQSYTLAELSDLGVANPAIRRMELMARIGGFERLAEKTGLFVPVFYTLTCPSKFHAYHIWGERNTKWNFTTPRTAQSYLQSVWERVRSAWDKAGVRAFGFRVVEPHHDGCPHWHLILWFSPDKQEKATAIFRHYAMVEDREEHGADKHRFKVVVIDSSKGSAAGYVVKYVSKNIDGNGIERDLFDGDAVESAARIEAWASTWGIRQFQQIGGPSVTVWRELRRARDEMLLDDKEFEAIQKAANEGDWAAFTDLMGGPLVARDDMPIRAHMVARVEKNDYDEIIMRIVGVTYKGAIAITRRHEWTITIRRASAVLDGRGGRAPPAA